ncbi:GDSL esterase/lipase At5g03610 [Ziziphus jujuba]|uniref:GDSL esterase/lipase At5g03610 n=1 Tax=Ziziphus jujuba TaxID=326968 RepID=A0ABM3IE40_ZIZJJ|nr:GDSL esterase/lipase At5g03610 [Ziziphus jujuba]
MLHIPFYQVLILLYYYFLIIFVFFNELNTIWEIDIYIYIYFCIFNLKCFLDTAWSLGIRSPVPYTGRGDVEKWEVENGMNFAYDGKGVFNTLEKPPNMSTQISFFQQLRQQKWYTKQELNPSIALLSLAGNDYGTSVVNHGNNPKDLSDLSKLVVNQLADNIKPILSLGVRKTSVTTIHPLRCLPQITVYSSWNSCNQDWNLLSNFHNQQLWQRMQSLNTTFQTGQKKNVIVVLDLYCVSVRICKAKDHNRKSIEALLCWYK